MDFTSSLLLKQWSYVVSIVESVHYSLSSPAQLIPSHYDELFVHGIHGAPDVVCHRKLVWVQRTTNLCHCALSSSSRTLGSRDLPAACWCWYSGRFVCTTRLGGLARAGGREGEGVFSVVQKNLGDEWAPTKLKTFRAKVRQLLPRERPTPSRNMTSGSCLSLLKCLIIS